MSKKGYARIIDNIYFMLKLIWKSSPNRIILNILFNISIRLVDFISKVLLLRYILNGFTVGIDFTKVLIFIVAIVALKILIRVFESYFINIYVPISDLNIFECIQKMLFKKATEVDISCYENPEFYDSYVKALTEAHNRSKAIIESISEFVGILVYISLTSYVIFTISPILFSFIFIPIIAGGIIGKYKNRVSTEFDIKKQEIVRKKDYMRRTFYLKEYAKEIKLTNISEVLFRRFNEVVRELIQLTKKYGIKQALMMYLFFISNEIISDTLVLFYASYNTLITKKLFLGDFFVVIDSLGDVAWSFREMVDIFIGFEVHSIYIDNLRKFLNYECKIDKNDNGFCVDNPVCDLKLKNVSFKYDGTDRDVLKNINMEIKHKQRIALVGNNGAGKTTLIKLIMRLYEPTQGVIYLNGRDIKEYNLDSYRHMYGTVFQDFKMFALSIAENVAMSEVNSQEQRDIIQDALKASGIYKKVDSLEGKANTIVTREIDEDGVVLSGGEYQKIALSRIMAKPNSIVILDEPSSALDPIAEYQIFETMLETCKDKTVIFISHRLSSAVMADKIYLLNDGEIVEQGSHKELMLYNGLYADMFRKQADKYLDGEG